MRHLKNVMLSNRPCSGISNQVPTLLRPSRNSSDAQLIWRAAVAAGWRTERLAGWKVPELQSRDIAFYGESLLAAHVAESLNVSFIEAPLDWLTHLPVEYLKRRVAFTRLGEARRDRTARFLKPANDKAFPATSYRTEDDFALLHAYDDNVPTLESEIVPVIDEYRFFVLNRTIQTGSVYCKAGRVTEQADGAWEDDAIGTAEAFKFATRPLNDSRVFIPPAIVLDVCTTADRGWMVLECNPCWGSGVYGCDPHRVLPVIARACVSNEKRHLEDPRCFPQPFHARSPGINPEAAG
jgi:hypothetical protein